MPALCCAVASCALTRLANQEGLGAEKKGGGETNYANLHREKSVDNKNESL